MPVCIAIFQFTPLREGRPDDRNVPAERLNISIHAPPRGATFSATGFPSVVRFQFTPLREGRQTAPQPHSGRQTDFNSRPSARGDTDKQRRASAATISIHAPPRGATRRKGGDATRHAISIHAPPRGATKQRRARAATTTHFNSRPSARGDISEQKERMVHHISIHAPPRGATNPPPPRAAVPLFQFTPLREGRRSVHGLHKVHDNFNSRPSARGDRLQHPSKPLFPISIHAPPRGATVQIGAGFLRGAISIHAPPRGATRVDCHKNRFKRTISIHAPPRGATSPRIRGNGFRLISIHAPPRGATCRFACCFLAFCISIHAPPRGATEPAAATRGGTPISIHAPPRGATFCPWASQSP